MSISSERQPAGELGQPQLEHHGLAGDQIGHADLLRRRTCRTGSRSSPAARVASVDVDAYVAAHRGEWERLEQLLRRRRLSGDEVDELVWLYQRVTTHLSVVRSASPDPALVGRLTTLVARARSAVTGQHRRRPGATSHGSSRSSIPAALYRSARWWVVGRRVAFCLVGLAVGVWVAHNPHVQATIAAPDADPAAGRPRLRGLLLVAPGRLLRRAGGTNNAWVTALALVLGVFLRAGDLAALAERAQRRHRRRPDGRARPARPVLRADPPARPARAHLRVRGYRRRAPAGLVLDRPRAAQPVAGARARRARPRARWPSGLAATLVVSGVHRGVRDAVAAADLGPDRHRRRRSGLAFLTYVVRARRPRRAAPASSATVDAARGATDVAADRRASDARQLRAGRRP